MSIEELVEKFGMARHDRYEAVKQEILKIGSPAVPFLVRAYRSKKIDMWHCFQTILEMGPGVYVPILEATRDDNEEALAILTVVANHREALPEAIPILIDGLQSPNSIKILRCMEAILNVYPLIEVHHRGQVPQFARATNRLLDLLGHENEHVRQQAALCIAMLRPAEPDIMPALTRILGQKNPCTDISETHALIRAIGAYGPDAAGAVRILTEILRSQAYPALKTETARALAAIGSAGASAIPLLEELRDKTQLRFKSDTKHFKRRMAKAIKTIQNAATPSTRQKKRRGDPYLLNLVKRMGQHDDANTAGKAHEEARGLTDASLVPRIIELLDGRLSRWEFYHLMVILKCVTLNTGSADGRRLILSLFSREHRRKTDLNPIIMAAAGCNLKEASPLVRQLLFKNNGCHVLDALDYFKATKDDSAVDDIGRCIQEWPRYALLCIFALGDIGSPRAVPYLLGLIRGNLLPNKKANCRWRYYSIGALGELKAVDAVPDLIQMLSDRRYNRYWSAIINALCLIEDERAFVAVVGTLRKVIETKAFAQRWSPGYHTIVVNCLDYLNRIGKRDDPFVTEVVEVLRAESNWNRLLEEEKRFIDHVYGTPK